MKDSNKVKKYFRVIGSVFSLVSVPLLSSLVFLNPAHAEGDDIVCNKSKSSFQVVLRAQNSSGGRNYSPKTTMTTGDCKQIFWKGDRNLGEGVTEWILVSTRKGPFASNRYVSGVGESAGFWQRLRLGYIVVK